MKKISVDNFGDLNGEKVKVYTLQNDHGMEVSCINYGCIITKIMVPDVNGHFENVVLGFDSLEEYQLHSPYFGAVCGRVAGRIAYGEFELNGKPFHLVKNDGNNHLHGGMTGFDKVIWDARVIEEENKVSVEFSRTSPDGEEGYPGNLEMKVTYSLTNENELIIVYNGECNQDTLVNVTNHTYFNLSGNVKNDMLEHTMKLKSSNYVELNSELIPTGKIIPVEGTPFDFREARKIKDGVQSEHLQNVLVGNGYDHPFLLDVNQQQEIILEDLQSGRQLIVETDQPSVVVYSGNSMESDYHINGVKVRNYLGICLETQGVPDAIHHSHFPPIVLRKGEEYNTTTKYTFLVVKE